GRGGGQGRVSRRAPGGGEPGRAAGRDGARPAPLARDHGPAADAEPAARRGRDRRRGVSPAGRGGRLGRAVRCPGRVVPAAPDGRRGTAPPDVTGSQDEGPILDGVRSREASRLPVSAESSERRLPQAVGVFVELVLALAITGALVAAVEAGAGWLTRR